MKRMHIIGKTLFLLTFTILSIFTVTAERKEIESFRILTPRTTGMGNAYVSMAKGFETLWTNPAGFNTDKTELNILGFNASALGNPDVLVEAAGNDLSSVKNILEALSPAITGDGAGINTALGISWVGKNAGFGLYNSLDVYIQGDPFPDGSAGYADNTVSLIGGYAYPFVLSDTVVLTAGLTLRPSIKYRKELDGTTIGEMHTGLFDFEKEIADKLSYPAFAVPVDFGTRATFSHGFSAAFAFKDIFANYSGENSAYEYYTPWSVNLGGAWNPNLKNFKWLLDPTFSLEISHLNRIIEGHEEFFSHLHIGAELAFLKNFLTLWAGLDGGYPAFGTSLDLVFMDISAAYGSVDYRQGKGGKPISNFTVEVSFRLD